ncbi:hypothetical protein AB0J28_00370 [Streptosporangium canum]|uniref:hypothetical protein n=1 Tax=Streptosporangium canum TaxID=324952 RepID=UPI00343B3DF9
MSTLLPGFELGQEVDITFRGAQVADIGGNFIDVELADGEELTVLPGADGVEVRPVGLDLTADWTPEEMRAALAWLAENWPVPYDRMLALRTAARRVEQPAGGEG